MHVMHRGKGSPAEVELEDGRDGVRDQLQEQRRGVGWGWWSQEADGLGLERGSGKKMQDSQAPGEVQDSGSEAG